MKESVSSGVSRRLSLGVVLLGLVALVTARPAQSDALTMDREDGILAIGETVVSDANVAAARQRALSHALERGVESYLLKRLGGKTVAGQFSRFVQELVPAAREEIANYNILEEEEIGGRYRVLVRLRVNEETIEEVLDRRGFLYEEGPPVKLLFLVSQSRSGADAPVYWWKDPAGARGLLPLELALNRVFEGMGFTLASRALKVPEGEGAERLKRHDLTLEDAAEWGRLCSADVVILGSSVLTDALVSVHLKAVDVSTAEVMSEQGAQASLDPNLDGEERSIDGIDRAARNVSARLATNIRKAFQHTEGAGDRIAVTLSGIGSFTQLQQFTRFLVKSVPGVESVTQTRFKGDTVGFSVAYDKGPANLLETLLNRPELPFPVNAQQTEDGGILVTPL